MYRFCNTARYLSKVDNFNHPHLNLVPPQGLTPVDFAEIFGTRKLESLGYHVVLFALPLMSRCEYSFFFDVAYSWST